MKVMVLLTDGNEHEVSVPSLPYDSDDIDRWTDDVLHPAAMKIGLDIDEIDDWWKP